jgi:hypothetical protein
MEKERIITPGGMTYRILALDPNSRYMSLPVIRKICDLVNAGAIVAGSKPLNTPSLSDDAEEFKVIADKLWANENGVNVVGKGKVYAGQALTEVLKSLELPPDFGYAKPQDNTNLLFVHRKLENIDFYWVNNRNNRFEDVEATFRVSGKKAEVWHPETGKIEDASYTIDGKITKVPLQLTPDDAVFVVFRDKAKDLSVTIPKLIENELASVEGPWRVTFQEERGAPGEITLDELSAWNGNSDPGIKYFSGTGIYSKTIEVKEEWLNNGHICIDLGEVKNLAEVTLNGKSLGIVWKQPFRIDVTGAVKAGENTLEIKVTNLWVNRLIGDQQPGIKTKYTYTTMPFYRADSPLKPSGLLGPVRILSLN